MRFDETVSVTGTPTLDLSVGSGLGCSVSYSDDRQTVYLTAALPNTETNETLRMNSISGLSVKDESGNAFTYSNSGLPIGTLSYRSDFNVTSRLTNLHLSGDTTAHYGSDYTAELIPEAGYQNPEKITVTVNGNEITDYTYTQSSGQIVIRSSAIRGDTPLPM